MAFAHKIPETVVAFLSQLHVTFVHKQLEIVVAFCSYTNLDFGHKKIETVYRNHNKYFYYMQSFWLIISNQPSDARCGTTHIMTVIIYS